MSDIQKIKDKLDIVSVVGTYIKLEKAGNNFKARCPFHNEKSPSFFVSPERNAYYCFGCHAKGDIFTFVGEFEGLDFVGSLKVLAQRAGITLEGFNSESNPNKTLFTIMDTALFYFQKRLQEEIKPREYLKLRGITDDTISKWQIGYCDISWRGLFDFLTSKGFKKEDMLSCGLIKRKEGTDTYYDTFRGRIMFPIFDSSGRVIAFSGRILIDDGKSPKYLNSPETVLFSKSDVLYGLDKAKYKIKEKDSVILVEGQMDLIMLHQSGFENTTASSGTALTEKHLEKLRRFTTKIILAFDGDGAGLSATIRSASMALPMGLEVYVCAFPEGSDPADVALSDKSLLKDTIENSSHVVLFLFSKILKEEEDELVRIKRVNKEVLPLISLISSLSEQSYFVRYMADRLRIKESLLFDDLRRISVKLETVDNTFNTGKQIKNNTLRSICSIIIWQEQLANPKIDIVSVKNKLKEIVGDSLEGFISDLEKEKESLLFQTESYYNTIDKLQDAVFEMLVNLELEFLQKEFEDSLRRLKDFEKNKDQENVEVYLKKCKELSNKINNIKKTYEKK